MSVRSRLVTLCVIAAWLFTSCGIGMDDQPRPLGERPSTTTTSVAPTQGSGQGNVVLYYTKEGSILPAAFESPGRTLGDIIRAQLAAPSTSATIPGLGTSIPSGTELIGVEREGKQIWVNLSSDFDNVVATSRAQALGQIVMAVSHVVVVDNIFFQIDGNDTMVSSPVRGDIESVNACDFRSLLGKPDEWMFDLPEQSMTLLRARHTQLEKDCHIS